MELDSNNQNSFIYIQSLDKNQKFNLQSEKSSSLNQLSSTISLRGSHYKKTNLHLKNTNNIFGSFLKNEKDIEKKDKKKVSKIQNNNINKELFPKFITKSFIKHIKKKDNENPFETKKLINPEYLANILEDIGKKTPRGRRIYLISQIHYIVSVLIIINLTVSFFDIYINKKESSSYLKKIYIEDNEYEKSLKKLKNRKLTKTENFLRSISIITGFIMCFLLLKKEYLIYKYNLDYQTLKKRLTILIICSLCFPPVINPLFIIKQKDYIYPFFVVDIFFLINISKIYILNYLILGSSRYGNLITISICKTFSVKPRNLFAMRAKLKDYPFLFSLFLIILIFLLSLFLLKNFEFGIYIIDKNDKEKKEIGEITIMNIIWFISMFCFGNVFGDYYPKTIITRSITVILIILLFSVVSYILLNIMKFTIMNESERKVFLKMIKLYSPENIEYKAADVILHFLQLRKDKLISNKQENKESKVFYYKKISINILMLNRLIKNYKNNDKIADVFTIPADDLLITVENKIHENMNNFEYSFNKLQGIESNLIQLKKLQKNIDSNLKDIIDLKKNIGKYLVNINNKGIIKKIKKKILKNKNFFRFSKDYTINKELLKNFSEKRNLSFLKSNFFHKNSLLQKRQEKQDTKIIEKNTDEEEDKISNDKDKNELRIIKNEFRKNRYIGKCNLIIKRIQSMKNMPKINVKNKEEIIQINKKI